jgi:hypothetical protein
MIAATYNMMLDTGFLILDEIRNFFISLIFRKGPYNKLIIFPGTVNGQVFIPAKDGIFDQHRASSNQYLYASSNKFDKRTQTCLLEALASLVLLIFFVHMEVSQRTCFLRPVLIPVVLSHPVYQYTFSRRPGQFPSPDTPQRCAVFQTNRKFSPCSVA